MSVRASVGTSYEVPSGGWFNNSIAPPWMPTIIRTEFPGGLDDPWAGYPGGNPFPLPPIDVNAAFPPDAAYYAVSENSKPLTKHSWNLSVQRQIASDWLVSASYLGSQASHLWGNQERNPAVFIPGNCQAGQFGLTAAGPCSNTGNLNPRRRLFLDYPNIKGTTVANVSQYIDAGTQSYHGLLLSVQRRAARGVTVGSNYTWSLLWGRRQPLGRRWRRQHVYESRQPALRPRELRRRPASCLQPDVGGPESAVRQREAADGRQRMAAVGNLSQVVGKLPDDLQRRRSRAQWREQPARPAGGREPVRRQVTD
jgi:hypothetical protein